MIAAMLTSDGVSEQISPLPSSNDPFIGQPHPRPQCTHTHMDRLHGPYRCDQCGRMPDFGWIYQCAQDLGSNAPISLDDHMSMARLRSHRDTEKAVHDQDHLSEDQDRVDLVALGLSRSVLAQYDAGSVYTTEQVDKIKEQKSRFHEEVARALNRVSFARRPPPRSSDSPQRNSPANHQHADTKSGLLRGAHSREPAPTMRHFHQSGSGSANICNFRCCHRCRQYYSTRIYSSFETVLNETPAPFTRKELGHLHVLDARILMNIDPKPRSQALTVDDLINTHDFANDYPPERISELSSTSGSLTSSESSSCSMTVYHHSIPSSTLASSTTSPVTSTTNSSLTSPVSVVRTPDRPPKTPASTRAWPGITKERSPLSTRTAVPHNVGLPFSNTPVKAATELQTGEGAEQIMSPGRGYKSITGSKDKSPIRSDLPGNVDNETEVEVNGGITLLDEAASRKVQGVGPRDEATNLVVPTEKLLGLKSNTAKPGAPSGGLKSVPRSVSTPTLDFEFDSAFEFDFDAAFDSASKPATGLAFDPVIDKNRRHTQL